MDIIRVHHKLSTVTEIGDYAFGACGSLREFLLHDMG
jgi:hypothetical protein